MVRFNTRSIEQRRALQGYFLYRAVAQNAAWFAMIKFRVFFFYIYHLFFILKVVNISTVSIACVGFVYILFNKAMQPD